MLLFLLHLQTPQEGLSRQDPTRDLLTQDSGKIEFSDIGNLATGELRNTKPVLSKVPGIALWALLSSHAE